ncbi:MAG TPA: IS630 family transposase [Isosphaeraceae bacterium]|nr:IS630 family transposase [Isosphaeraceae bacterium]
MKPYSMDLRQRIAAAIDHGEGSFREIARRFRVSLSFIARLLHRRRQAGTLEPKPHGGGHPPALDHEGEERLRERVRQHPDATLNELRQRLGVACSRSALARALERRELTRKKKTLHAEERNRPENQAKRQAFRATIATIDPHRLVFVDETGTNTAMARAYGRAPRGERVVGTVPGQWTTVTLISALRLSGVVAPLAFEGATDTPAFQTYVAQALVPQLQPGDVVIWDNLKPHQDVEVKQLIEQAGAELVPLPPYSSDLTPIEELWSKAKTVLKSAAARTMEALYDAMGAALRSVRPEDILGWFRFCGWCGGPESGSPDSVYSINCGSHHCCSLCATQS